LLAAASAGIVRPLRESESIVAITLNDTKGFTQLSWLAWWQAPHPVENRNVGADLGRVCSLDKGIGAF
jgi:hypothetical protein